MAGAIYVSGRFQEPEAATINVLDHGLLYGDGVFEGIRAYDGRVFKLDRHLERLFKSARAVRMDPPCTPAALEGIVLETCRRNAITDGYIRVILTRGVGDLGLDPRSCGTPQLIVIARPSVVLYRDASRGIRMMTSSSRRPAPDALSPSIKSLNYLNNVLARIEASDHGADEALILDQTGHVAEATADNVFIVTRRGLVTPPTSTNLDGITRETVIEIASDLRISCEERPFNLFEVWTAEEMFICGTGAEIVPVLTVDGRTIGTGAIGSITARIVDAYGRMVRTSGTPIGLEVAAAK